MNEPLLYQVRFNGNIVLATPSRERAEEEFYELVGMNPTCEAAIIYGTDENGDECKTEVYSG